MQPKMSENVLIIHDSKIVLDLRYLMLLQYIKDILLYKYPSGLLCFIHKIMPTGMIIPSHRLNNIIIIKSMFPAKAEFSISH